MAVKRNIDAAARLLTQEIARQFTAQGHRNTGRFISSLRFKTRFGSGLIDITVTGEGYGLILNNGVRRNRIPFNGTRPRGQGSGRRSAYIEGLKKYVKQRGIASGDKEALGIAFAIAKSHKNKAPGMPSKRSRRFSRNGKRTGFIEDAIKEVGQEMEERIADAAFGIVDVEISKAIKELKQTA